MIRIRCCTWSKASTVSNTMNPASSAPSAIFRNAETGVSRSATISLHTGTNVPRRANSLNSSNDVIFIGTELRKTFHGGRSHDGGRRSNAGPPAKLFHRLRDEHVEA